MNVSAYHEITRSLHWRVEYAPFDIALISSSVATQVCMRTKEDTHVVTMPLKRLIRRELYSQIDERAYENTVKTRHR
jgi:hypothetical protein